MVTLFSGLGALVGVVLGLLVIGVVNAGNVYKSVCPSGNGTTEVSWDYKFSIPYIGYHKVGCETHTATAVALDAMGIRDLNETFEAEPVENHRAEYPADFRAQYIDFCTAEQDNEADYCGCTIDEMMTRLSPSEFQRVLEAAQRGADTFDELGPLADKAREVDVAITNTCVFA